MPPQYADPVFLRMPADGPLTTQFGQVITIGGQSYPHRGVDIGCDVGTPVYAPAAGRIVAFTNDGSFGNGVCIDHPGTEWYSLLAHLSGAQVSVGQAVEAGQRVGTSGNTGKTTGPHLHWQLCKSAAFPPDIAQSTDPLQYLHPGHDNDRTPAEAYVTRAELAAMFEAMAATFRGAAP